MLYQILTSNHKLIMRTVRKERGNSDPMRCDLSKQSSATKYSKHFQLLWINLTNLLILKDFVLQVYDLQRRGLIDCFSTGTFFLFEKALIFQCTLQSLSFLSLSSLVSVCLSACVFLCLSISLTLSFCLCLCLYLLYFSMNLFFYSA